jgi:hypothetical protein
MVSTCRRIDPSLPVAAMLLALSGLACAQPAGRIDATLPQGEPARRAERIESTRPLRDASEAMLRDELARHADLDRLANPHFDRPGGAAWVQPSVYPTIRPQAHPGPSPCVGTACVRPPPPGWAPDRRPPGLPLPTPIDPRRTPPR